MALAGLLIIDVLFRELFWPLQFIPELSVFVMVAVTYLGLSPSEEHDEHVRISYMADRLPCNWSYFLQIVVQVITVITVILFLWAISSNAIDSFNSGEGTEGMFTIKLWRIKFIMVFGVAVFLAETVRRLHYRMAVKR